MKRTVKTARANRARAMEFALSPEGRAVRERMLRLPKSRLVEVVGHSQTEFFLAKDEKAAKRAVSKLNPGELRVLTVKLINRGHVHKIIEEIEASL